MRMDYVSYAIAIILFIITLSAVTYQSAFKPTQVWIITPIVIGLAFIGLGYTQRPKISTTPVTNIPTSASTNIPSPPPSPAPQPVVEEATKIEETKQIEETKPVVQPLVVVTEPVKLEETKPVVVPQPAVGGLTEVRGIGEKRAAQLRALGINSVEELSKASAKDLAAKLNISAKITTKWIENAKEI